MTPALIWKACGIVMNCLPLGIYTVTILVGTLSSVVCWLGIQRCGQTTYGPRCELTCLGCLVGCDDEGWCLIGQCISIRRWGPGCLLTCPDNFYLSMKLRCTEKCHCAFKSSCHITSGFCVRGGCKPGWSGPYCSKICDAGYFGKNCVERCHCRVPPCHPSSGKCSGDGCLAGWKGSRCDIRCPVGRYGPNCWGVCSCRAGLVCNAVEGCLKPCPIRYTGRNCNTTCPRNRYLINGSCTGPCNCLDNRECRVADGACAGGLCAKGWRGKACHRKCVRGTYGLQCSKLCHCLYEPVCNHVNGSCKNGCAVGYIGASCDTAIHTDESKYDSPWEIVIWVLVAIILLILVTTLYAGCTRLLSCLSPSKPTDEARNGSTYGAAPPAYRPPNGSSRDLGQHDRSDRAWQSDLLRGRRNPRIWEDTPTPRYSQITDASSGCEGITDSFDVSRNTLNDDSVTNTPSCSNVALFSEGAPRSINNISYRASSRANGSSLSEAIGGLRDRNAYESHTIRSAVNDACRINRNIETRSNRNTYTCRALDNSADRLEGERRDDVSTAGRSYVNSGRRTASHRTSRVRRVVDHSRSHGNYNRRGFPPTSWERRENDNRSTSLPGRSGRSVIRRGSDTSLSVRRIS